MSSKKISLFFSLFLIFLLLILSLNFALAIDSNETRDYYFLAEQKIQEMQKKGYPTLPLYDLLSKSQQEYNLGDYNTSYFTSTKIFEDSVKIENLFKDLEKTTQTLKTLNSLGVDTTSLELNLLYAKSDFESANIDLSENETNDLNIKIYSVSLNLSKEKYNEIKDYKTKLELNYVPEEYFLEYYKNLDAHYKRREYLDFLSGMSDFETIKEIIHVKLEFESDLKKLKKQNIGFKRANDGLSLFYIQINESKYIDAKKTIDELSMSVKTAINLKKQLNDLSIQYERIKALDILDNDTIDLFSKAKNEFSLENFDESKRLADETSSALQTLETQNIIFGGIKKAQLKKGLKDFFINNWPYILAFICFLIIIFNPSKNYVLLYRSKKIVMNSNYEKEAIISLQKDLQKEYYINHAIDKKTYHQDFSRHEERKVELLNKITFHEEKEKDYKEYFKKLRRRFGFNTKKPKNR